ncbi:Rha family transcriptional regulator [Capnocytophaga catalasegens]|uniref:Uncharacterized protein n=1 Tax=Capnocytophaga catalasegens TaxID=1004260 RepID=A0AAV5AXP6_9FLAO|nr:Rha family transcriptional regulator [Capnocytophaga catalasegens]GIZ15753.1 hypothetical protein RCZ03_17530 [Capnocytophaga catalasegens]GJM49492.1 hypothetical protein RCZ15_04670 [Capnocytophaga catalasegens]GJM54246.1 hypothetical protein RCZ16_25620 [Capnocytophaga catalasegens]
MTNLINTIEQTMSSWEIAQLTGKRHQHVIRDIENLNVGYEKLQLPKIGFMFIFKELNNGGGKKIRTAQLTKMQTFDLLTGYNTELRIKVNRRWAELEEKMILHIPAPKIINGVKCVHYVSFLIQNKYSLMSSRVAERRRKYPEHFIKYKGEWYMTEGIANYFLNYKEAKNKLAQLPFVNPKQLKLFE